MENRHRKYRPVVNLFFTLAMLAKNGRTVLKHMLLDMYYFHAAKVDVLLFMKLLHTRFHYYSVTYHGHGDMRIQQISIIVTNKMKPKLFNN